MSTNNDLYTMDDSDFLNADPDKLFAEGEPSAPVSDSDVDTEIEQDLDNDGVEVDSAEEIEPETLDDDIENTDDNDIEDFEPNTDEDEDASEDDSETEDDDEEVDTEEEETGSVDNELLEEILAPLKHRGSEFKPKDVEEARRLMSMGLDYARKTKELKDQRKYLKMLDNHELLDESKLSFAIDLLKGDKDAIAQLVQNNGIDVMELEEGKEYTPSNHAVSANEVELDDVIESIRSTESFADTMNIVNNWDESSKRELASKPQLLAVMNEHKSNGVYAMIDAEVQRERMIGGLAGLSDVEAYQAMGNKLFQQGRFNDAQPQAPVQEPKKVVRKPKAKADDKQLQDKRRKANATQNKGRKPESPSYDWWNMSDDEVENFKL